MKLDVWLEAYSNPVGTLVSDVEGSLSFSYAEGAERSPQISMSLPLRAEPYGDAAARAYFGNLLFEGNELERVRSAYKLDRNDVAGLLFYLGADCPGSISVTPVGEGPGKRPGVFPDDYIELRSADLLSIVRSLHFYGRMPDGTKDPSPIAGIQPKIALVLKDGRYYLPAEGTRAPTTHILKISPRADPSLTRHEAALLSLAQAVKLEVSRHTYVEFEDDETNTTIGGILSTRFDRSFEDGRIRRIHTEDLCQALGLPQQLKYERNAVREDLRFSTAAVGKLAKTTAVPGLFIQKFFRQTLFNLFVGNTDNHAKNSSIIYRGTRGELAPLYDVVPVLMDKSVTHEFAFSLGGAKYAEDLTQERLHRAVTELGFGRKAILDSQSANMLRGLVALSGNILEKHSGKLLADAVNSQIKVVDEALKLNLDIPTRDYFARQIRDGKPEFDQGGWATGPS